MRSSKKSILLLILSLFIMTAAFAHGKRDNEETEAENLNSWQQNFDLEKKTKKKAVKYNILVKATDLAGNSTVEGPFNIYVDPESDKPVCSITNPYLNMRIVGNLNIVGTCVDDDGVSKVELILDEGKVNSAGESIEHREVASGKEFWSYYLDTTKLEEGPHTIKVIGYDINGLASNPVSMQWQLDRQLPVTAVNNFGMGQLVSGVVDFKGEVSDGNGISELYYSVDNGNFFAPVKITNSKLPKGSTELKNARCDFSFTVDTRKFMDGAAVIWFKAIDDSGSVGYYSFLYFIDNTKPDVQVIYPSSSDEVDVHGKYSIAGYAKDTNGIQSLTWTCGDQKGEFELIPGNPYWSVTLETGKSADKVKKFVIHAVDRAGNVVDVTKELKVNVEKNLPTITLLQPAEGQIFTGDDSSVYVRGIAKCAVAVDKVKIQIDGKEAFEQETRGAFFLELCKASDLSAGAHKITVTGISEDGLVGHPVSVNIVSRGVAPTFEKNVVKNSKGANPFVMGQEIHPESGSTFEVTAVSQLGIKKIHALVKCGNEILKDDELELKDVSSYTYSVPVAVDSPKGLISVTLTATDTLDRDSTYKGFFRVTNTAKVTSNEMAVVFDDSVFTEVDGILEIETQAEFPATGYLIGANAVSVELAPPTPFATAKLEGNRIILTPGAAVGRSVPVTVRVRTDRNGRVVESKRIIFKNDTAVPTVKNLMANGTAYADVPAGEESYTASIVKVDGGRFNISGTAICQTGIGSLRYRVIKLNAEVNPTTNVISKVTEEIPEEFQAVSVNARSGAFTFSVDTDEYENGVFVVEMIAESAGGNKVSRVVAFSKLPEPEMDPKGKAYPAKLFVNWINSLDLFCVASYQEELENAITVFPRSEMVEGQNAKQVVINAEGKSAVYKSPAVLKDTKVSANFVLLDDRQYQSGMPLEMAYATGKDGAHKLVLYVDTTANVSSVSYEITGAKVAGGDERQTGNAALTKSAEVPNRWVAEIPLYNLPSRVTNIKATVKSSAFSDKVVTGSIIVVRPESEMVNDDEVIYAFDGEGVEYDSVDGNYVLSKNGSFYYFINVASTFKVELISSANGLAISSEGNLVTLTAEKEGMYRSVKIRVTDAAGRVFESKPMNFLADYEGPVLAEESQTPKLHQWVKNTVILQGAAQDELGVRSVEYSFDGGESWSKFTLNSPRGGTQGVTFTKNVDISSLDDGLVVIDYKATDNAGHVTYYRTACYKDTVAPDVQVIEPLSGDVVNGENLMVFKVKDNVVLEKAEYVNSGIRNEMTLEPLVTTYVGTNEQPINNRMSFTFTDGAGNAKVVNSYEFSIDSKSDLPVTEIHIPEELQVLTRDFIVSGVVYDDDGDSTIFYKVDNGPYKQVSTSEVYGKQDPTAEYKMDSCFEILIPISEMTDNEHSITIYAVDANGVKGEEVTRKFRISLEEPKGEVIQPTIDNSVREVVEITGVASDKNGIAKVEVSLDNGNSYNDAVGKERWSYKVDTRAIPGGTSVMFFRITDNYGITGLYSTLINIDNEAPHISLDLPLDDSTSTGQLFFSGYAYDNVEITKMYVTIRNMERTSQAIVRELKIDRIIGETLDISDLPNGFYNIEVSGEDKAGNRTNVSRNIHIDKTKSVAQVDVLYPLNGEHKSGYFNIYGQITEPSDDEKNQVEKLRLYVDGKFVKETEPTRSGFYKFEITPPTVEDTKEYDETGAAVRRERADMTDGTHTYRVDALLKNGKTVSSREQMITYSKVGPWLTLDNFTYGDFAQDRPYLRGRAGYYPSAEEEIRMNSKEVSKEEKDAYIAKKTIAKVEVSFDNGKTFEQVSTTNKWMVRIENQDLEEGYHFMLVRVTMKNGDIAIERSIIQIDNTHPSVKLISPGRGGHYNQMLDVSGLSSDDIGLKDVSVELRKGDKSSYEVPAFIQGLYLDFHFWGATLYEVGAGLTFFDDNVKVQATWGQFTQAQRDSANSILGKEQTEMRYGGDNIFGFKLLANIAALPFSYFFGHDWDWLYANFAVGAQFSRFNQTNSGKPQWLSSVIGQMEFPKIVRNGASMFSSFAFYTEGSVWFIPTDVSGDNIDSIVFQGAIGLRVNIF